MYAKILSALAGALGQEFAFFEFFEPALGLSLACLGYVLFSRRTVYLWFYLAGCLYSGAHLQWVAAHQLAFDQSGDLFWVTGTVSQVARPARQELLGHSFTVSVTSASEYSGRAVAIQTLRVSSYGQLRPERYQACEFYVRLKPPVGASNPGGPNREVFYFVRRISGLGYVINHPDNNCSADTQPKTADRLRAKLLNAFQHLDVAGESKAVLMSLALAERAELSAHQWTVFQRTGTAHLLAISGLHIGLVASLVFFAVRSLLFMANRRDARQNYRMALLFAIAASTGYAALSGFLLPTQRALVVVLIFAVALMRGRQILSFETLAFSALVVVVLDPLAMLTLGFWMSFSAVGILVLLRAARPFEHWLLSVFQTHCLLSLGTLPLTMLISETLPVSAPLANLIAVPTTCFAIVPLVLLGVLLAILALPGAGASWQLAALLWEILWEFLQRLHNLSPAISLAADLGAWRLALMVLGTVVLIAPLIPHRWLFAALCYGQIFFVARAPLAFGEWRLITLDVGQGLASIVETANHVAVFDTGPARGDYSAGKSILRPALSARGHHDIDKIIVSHADNDHAGGLDGLIGEEHLAASQILTARPAALGLPALACHAGQQWVWDGVHFSIIAPMKRASGSENDRSCVLKIDSKFGSGLLPGDIESMTESLLLAQCAECLNADVLIAPHHGSDTSSTPEFVRAVNPRVVIFAAGYQNRFGFPSAAVSTRYLSTGAKTFITGRDGAVHIGVSEDGIDVATARRSPLGNARR